MTQVWFVELTFRNEAGDFRSEEVLKILGAQLTLEQVLDSVTESALAKLREDESLWQLVLSRRAA